MRGVLQANVEGGSGKSFLFLSQPVRVGGILLWIFYPRSVQSGVLYDYFAGFFASGTFHEDGKGLVCKVMQCGGYWRFRDLFLDAFKGDVCCGCKAASLFELDI